MQNLSVNEVVEFALNIERNGRDFYQGALERKDLNDEARALITILRNEEIHHEEYFKTLRGSDDLAELVDPDGWEIASAYLGSIIKAHIFNKAGSAIKMAAEAKDTIEILEFAMLFEKDTLLYFHSLYAETKNERALKTIGSIIKEEMRHLQKLQEALVKFQ